MDDTVFGYWLSEFEDDRAARGALWRFALSSQTTNRYRGGQREEDRWEVNAFLRRPEG
jgi:hypothetical protein